VFNCFLTFSCVWIPGLQYTLMKDPVILPSSKITIDRPVIQRHLLSDSVNSVSLLISLLLLQLKNFDFTFICSGVQTDPFNRSHLTADMLIPNIELKAKIEEFVRSIELKRRGEDLSMQSIKATIQTTDTSSLID
jgi:ubiquitin conjugation factor E4 B